MLLLAAVTSLCCSPAILPAPHRLDASPLQEELELLMMLDPSSHCNHDSSAGRQARASKPQPPLMAQAHARQGHGSVLEQLPPQVCSLS